MQGHHVLGPVDDDQVTILIEVARVAGAQPAIVQGLRGGLRVAVVAFHHGWGAHQDFAALIDFDLRLRDGGSDGLEFDIAIPVQHCDPVDLGLSVDLLQIDTQGMEEPEHVRPESSATGVRPLEMAQP